MIKMNKIIKIMGTGLVTAVVSFIAILLSGLGTSSLQVYDGSWVSLNTIQLGGTEFILVMVLAVFLTATIVGYLFNALDKK